jgi:hypothetical protein
MAQKDSYLNFPLTNMPTLLNLPHFKIRSMARERLKREEDTFFKSNVFFLSYLLSPWAINFMPFLSPFFFFFFFAIKVVPLSPSPFTASYSDTPLYREIEQGRFRQIRGESDERGKN